MHKDKEVVDQDGHWTLQASDCIKREKYEAVFRKLVKINNKMSTKASNQIQISENVYVSNGTNSNEADLNEGDSDEGDSVEGDSNEAGLNGNVSKEFD
jgi:hypothetical protein